MVLLVELPLTRLTQRFDARRVMCIGYALIGLGFAVNLLAVGLPGLFLGMTIFTLGETLALPMMSTWIAHLAPEPMRGRYIGALSTSWAGASMIGPALGLQLFGWNPSALWIGCAVLGGMASMIMARWGDSGEAALAVAPPAGTDAVE
jgi:MFS family permease